MDLPRYRGTLKKWNAERGFGFILAEDSGQDVFVHITAFARDGRDPRVGEELTFEVEPDHSGKRSAVRVRRPGDSRPSVASTSQRQRQRPARMGRTREASVGQKAIAVVLLLLAGIFAYSRYDKLVRPVEVAAPKTVPTSVSPSLFESPQTVSALPPASAKPAPLFESSRPAQARFSCDGRQHCSQMTSCEEANFFLKNCPNTKMDGDHDGRPCEQGPC